MNIWIILSIVFGLITIFTFIFSVSELLIATVPLISLFLTIVFGAIGFVEHSHQVDIINGAKFLQVMNKRDMATASFSDSAYSVFQAIRQVEDSLPTGTPSQFGKIFLQDSSTIMITSSDKVLTNKLTNKNFGGKSSYSLSARLPNSDYILTGSLTADNKNWCFIIKENDRQAFYNQNGFVIADLSGYGSNLLGHSSCLDGVAYNVDGQAILGSINPK